MGFLFELISAIICIGMKIYWGHFLNNVLYDLWLYAPCWNSSWYFLVDLSHLVTISMLPDPAIGHFHSALCFSFRWKKLKLLCYLSKDIHDNKSSFFFIFYFFLYFYFLTTLQLGVLMWYNSIDQAVYFWYYERDTQPMKF